MVLYVQDYVEFFYLALIVVYLSFFYAFYRFSSRGKAASGGVDATSHAGMERKEKAWLAALIIVAVVGNAIVLSPFIPSASMGLYPIPPAQKVDISIANYTFTLPDNPVIITAGQPV